jgi:hypothetical protein
MNGFQLADSDMIQSSVAVALYVVFFSAAAGLVLGVLLLTIKLKIPVVVDWILILVCMCSGLIPFFDNLGGDYNYQTGVYVILAGYIIVLLTQIVSLIRRETKNIS